MRGRKEGGEGRGRERMRKGRGGEGRDKQKEGEKSLTCLHGHYTKIIWGDLGEGGERGGGREGGGGVVIQNNMRGGVALYPNT